MNQKKHGLQPVALGLTVAAAALRLLPHPPNFAPVGSIALFGGARLRGWQAYAVPLLAMLVTDPILSRMAGYPAYSWATLVIYCCFLINVLLGRMFLRGSYNAFRIGSFAVAGSIQFYLITNLFTWWQSTGLYPHNWSGLVECYVAALPFYSRTLLADLFYSGVLFSAHAFLSRHAAAEHPERAAI